MDTQDDKNANAPPLSIARLTAAFAKMLRPGGEAAKKELAEDSTKEAEPGVTIRGIVEAMLFVGEAENAPISSEQIAEGIRDVDPEEVETVIEQLNAIYERDDAPYRIQPSPGGYRFQLLEAMHRLRDRMQGRVRAAKLSAQALETLAVVAYKQPIGSQEIDALRGKGSSAALAQLIRRGLIERADSENEAESEPHYLTTTRFLRVFGLNDPEQLPRVAELDD